MVTKIHIFAFFPFISTKSSIFAKQLTKNKKQNENFQN